MTAVDSKKKATKPATIRATQEPYPKPTFQEEEEEEIFSGTPLLFLFYLEVVTLQKLVACLTGQDNDKEWNTFCQETTWVFCIWLTVSHFLVTDVIMQRKGC